MKYIIGPCALENYEHAMMMAKSLKALETELQSEGYDIEFIFKGSYKKANRSDHKSFHGVGVQNGYKIYQAIKETTGLKVTSDVHSVEEATLMGEVLDLIQIPHSLSRYTEIIEAAANTGKQISIKKGLFMDPKAAVKAVKKVHASEGYGGDSVILIERGNSFGYGDTIVDMRNFQRFNHIAGCVPCIDATHPSCDGRLAPHLAYAGVAAGSHMVFMEVHNSPIDALCDGKCSVKLDEVKEVIKNIEEIYSVVTSAQSITLK